MFFIAMWVIGWAQPPSPTFHIDVGTSFSYMLERVSAMKWTYCVWLVIYTFIVMIIILLLLSYEDLIHGKHLIDHDAAFEAVQALVVIYSLFSTIKVVALALVALYDMTTSPNSHYIAAGMAFACAMANTVCLYARRFIIVWHHHPLEKEQQQFAEGVLDVAQERYYRNARLVLALNTIWILFGLSLLIAFAATSIGLLEFFFTLYVVLDPCWQLWDFGNDPRCMEHHRPVAHLVLAMR